MIRTGLYILLDVRMVHVISSIIVHIHRSFVFNCYIFTTCAVNCRVGQTQKFQFFIPINRSARGFQFRGILEGTIGPNGA